MASADIARVRAGRISRHVFRVHRVKLRVRVLLADGETPFANRELTLGSSTMRAMLTRSAKTGVKTDAEGWLMVDPAPLGAIQLYAWPPEVNDRQARLRSILPPDYFQSGGAWSAEDWKRGCTALPPFRVSAGEVETSVRLPKGVE